MPGPFTSERHHGTSLSQMHMQEMVPATMGIECGEVQRLLIQVDASEAIHSVKLAEACGSTEAVRNLLKGRGFIMLSHYGLVQVLRVEAYVQGTIRLAGVCEQRNPFGRLVDRHYNSHFNHFV